MRQSVCGPFAARNLGAGLWLIAGTASGGEIYLRGAGPNAAEFLKDPSISMVGFDWYAEGVELELTGARGVRRLTARSAIIHDPKPRLYEDMPLASFDSEARRFWTRVFRLMRIPGGRLILGLIARRNRGRVKA
ncbi:MAG: hypothetical protein JWN43_4255 [Gammaproteobacteria bacterium]|nr:hypothetical protein [Gammaproteobacteria bacterium]